MFTKKGSKLLTWALAFVMAISLAMVPMSAEAETATEWSDSTSLPTSGNYKLMCDVTVAGGTSSTTVYSVTSGNSLTLDLNGYTVSFEPGKTSQALYKVSGSLVINDSSATQTGTITMSGSGTQEFLFDFNANADSPSMTINGGTIKNERSNSVAIRVAKGLLTVNGGSIINTATDGKAVSIVTEGTLEMNDGSIINGDSSNSSLGQSGKAIYLYVGTCIIKGGSVINYNDSDTKISSCIWMPGNNGKEQILTITGGYFNNACTAADANNTYYSSAITVRYDASAAEATITGGVFGDNKVADYLADGYCLIEDSEGVYTVYEGYALNYDANGGTGTISSKAYASGTSVTVATADGLSYTGYEFKSWNTAADGSGTPYMAGDTLTISGDVTLYAQWEEEATTIIPSISGNMTLSSSLAFNFLIDQSELSDASGYTLTITKATVVDGVTTTTSTSEMTFTEGTGFHAGSWVVKYDEFDVYEYESTLTAVLKKDGVEIKTLTTSISSYLNLIAQYGNSNEQTMANAALTYCQAAKTYYKAQTGVTKVNEE